MDSEKSESTVKMEESDSKDEKNIEDKCIVKEEKMETADENDANIGNIKAVKNHEDKMVECSVKLEKMETANENEANFENTKAEKSHVEEMDEDNAKENATVTTETICEIEVISSRSNLTSYFEKKDHSVNHVYQSEIPQICKDEPCQLGVDEAGRGPVLGPMVYGIAYAPLSQKQLLVDLGCADSKSLTEEKRDAIFDKICENKDKMGWAVDSISPNFIANSMYRRSKTSLNEVSMDSAISLIRKTLDAGVFVTEVYVDTVGKPEKYQAKLENLFPGIKITVAKKADSTYPIVSAASICAKVSRDHALRAWQFRESENETAYGSGYPNDPVTKTWLADNVDPIFGFPQLVRFSWSTAEKILESKAIQVEWEDPEEDLPVAEVKISKFFSKKNESARKRHNFFTHRCLSSATDL